jgi:hypothetical protein
MENSRIGATRMSCSMESNAAGAEGLATGDCKQILTGS